MWPKYSLTLTFYEKTLNFQKNSEKWPRHFSFQNMVPGKNNLFACQIKVILTYWSFEGNIQSHSKDYNYIDISWGISCIMLSIPHPELSDWLISWKAQNKTNGPHILCITVFVYSSCKTIHDVPQCQILDKQIFAAE